jgi:amino acid adenylation domain-containing protein/non-ribosomal peptide synthase protein (TIGR01720 family)
VTKKNSLLSDWKSRSKQSTKFSRVERTGVYPLSDAQKRLWVLQQIQPDNPFYHYTEQFVIRGVVDALLLRKSFEEIVNENEILRSNIVEIDGELFFRVNEALKLEYGFFEADYTDPEMHERILSDARQPFDLEKDPLVRFSHIQHSPDHFSVVLTMHHIVTDKWSMRVLREKWFERYAQKSKPIDVSESSVELDFFDYTEWEMNKQIRSETKQYWIDQLKDRVHLLELPYCASKKQTHHFRGKHINAQISGNCKREISQFCDQRKITPFVFFLTCFFILLYKYRVGNPMHIATVLSSRSKSEFEKIIGFFNNTILLQSDLDPHLSFNEIIKRVHQTVLDAFAHKDMPFDQLVQLLNPDRISTTENPLFNTMFLYHKAEKEEYAVFESVCVEVVDLAVSKFDLTLYVSEYLDHFDIVIEFATELFEESTIQNFLHQYTTLIDSCIQHPDLKIKDLNYLDHSTLNQILSKSTYEEFKSRQGHFLELFEKSVNSHPAQHAISDQTNSMNFLRLDQLANNIAHQILEYSSDTTKVIAFCCDRNIEAIVAIIAILKSGKAYIPIDPNYPKERNAFVLSDASIQVVLFDDRKNMDKVPGEYHGITIRFDEHFSSKPPNVEIDINDPAYIIYTSGSTGHPKGVIVNHLNLYLSTLARLEYYKNQPSNFLLLSSFSFDSSVAGIFWSLAAGGRLVISPERIEQDMQALFSLFRDFEISHTLLIPSLYEIFLEEYQQDLPDLEAVIVAGEACSSRLVQQHFLKLPHVRLYNEYGPTEASVWSTVFEMLPDFEGVSVPIGQACPHVNVYLLDEQMQFVAPGVPGQICIGGPGVTLGYLNDPEKTKQKFVHLSGVEDSIVYLTGDLGKMNHEGDIEFLGRSDFQVKIRGFRVELHEIQNSIQKYLESSKLEVVFTNDQLVVFHQIPDIEINPLKTKLKSDLPDYMIPTRYQFVDSFPLMPNGKVDINALKAQLVISSSQDDLENTDLPADNIQLLLIRIWEDVLNQPGIRTTDNYFSIGGDSIKSIRIISKVREEGLPIEARDIFTYQTIESLSPILKHRKITEQQVELEMHPEDLLPIQRWFFGQDHPEPSHWNFVASFEVTPHIQPSTLKSFLETHVAQERIYSFHFSQSEKMWTWSESPISADEVLIHLEESECDLLELNRSLDITRAPLLKWVFVTGRQNRVYLVAHHLVIDVISMNILLTQFQQFVSSGKFTPSSPPMFALGHQLNRLADQGYFTNEIDFWSKQTFMPFSQSRIDDRSESQYEDDQLILSKELVKGALNEAHRVLDLNPFEYFIGIFLFAASDIIPQNALTVNLEHHGREQVFGSVDVSNSLGWFTSYYPLTFSTSSKHSLLECFKHVKRLIRLVRHKGLGFGVLKYQVGGLEQINLGDINFNFIPDFSGGQRFPDLKRTNLVLDSARSEKNKRGTLLDVNVIEHESNYHINTSYHRDIPHTTIIQILESMQEMIEQSSTLFGDQTKIYTPSDFKYAELTDADLSILKSRFDLNKTDFISLTSNQNALLYHHLSQKEDEGVIISSIDIKGSIEISRFEAAIAEVISKHSSLRLSIAWEDISKPLGVVHQNVYAPICLHDISHWYPHEIKTYCDQLKKDEHNLSIKLDRSPIFRFHLVCVGPKEHHFVFVAHHINLDGWSTMLLFDYLIQAYENQAVEEKKSVIPITTIAEIHSSQQVSLQSSKLFWSNYLKGIDFTKVEILHQSSVTDRSVEFEFDDLLFESIHRFGSKNEVSIQNIIQAAWGITSSILHSTDHGIFGISISGRSSEVQLEDQKIGLYANVIPMKTTFNKEDDAPKIVKRIQGEITTLLTFQKDSLQSIAEATGLNLPLFDNLLVIENFPELETNHTQLQLGQFIGGITSVYPLTFIFIPSEKYQFKILIKDGSRYSPHIESIRDLFLDVCSSISNESDLTKLKATQFEIQQIPISPKVPNLISTPDHEGDQLIYQLINIWKNKLNAPDVDIYTNFFDTGGNSIIILQIFSEIERKLGYQISPVVLFSHPTISELATFIRNNYDVIHRDSIVPLKTTGSKTPFFCFHAGDGHVLFYKHLADQFASEHPVYAIQPKGLMEGQFDYKNINEMALDYIDAVKTVQPKGPYLFLATCFSNAVTFEMTRLLQNNGEDVKQLFIIDSGPPLLKHGWTELTESQKLLKLIKQGNFKYIKNTVLNRFKKRLPGMFKHKQTQQEMILDKAKALLDKLLRSYEWEPIDVQTYLIRSQDYANDAKKDYHIDSWKIYSKDQLHVSVINANHDIMFDKGAAKLLAAEIKSQLK